ncbi:hypothetical protein, partial [uncultured Methylobacterium sp.]|uniref:hypothetical protein n=1 Tax=uncultured Methylobacterium sp. TaxID=157278 RepID=UPI0035CB4D83
MRTILELEVVGQAAREGPALIFIHSSFRTASTYLWSCLRANPGATAYYEVFHEALDALSPEAISASTTKSWYSKHPDGAPYFLEYLPLLDGDHRVAGFDPSFSYERFIPVNGPSGAVSDGEAQYVRGLIAHTEARGRIPVLTDTRSIGRVAGLKAAAPGLHVLLYRNLFQQWCSYTEQANRVGRYFLDRTVHITHLARHDPILRDIAALFPVAAASEQDLNTFYRFVFLHLYCYAHAASAADLVLDINRVAVDAGYRSEIEHTFAGQGLHVDLSQARQSMAFSLLDLSSATEVREILTITGHIVIDSAPSESGRRFATQVLDDLLVEHERYEFHAKAMRVALGQAVGASETARAEASAIR